MAINNLLFSVQNMSPVMLNIGGKAQGYNNNLTDVAGLLGDASGDLAASAGYHSTAIDKVSLTFKSVGDKLVSDLAGVTAGAIKEHPELDSDYVICLIDDGSKREARVYSLAEILKNFEGTDAQKKELGQQLAANPLMVFNDASGLPPSAPDEASQKLAAELNSFLSSKSKIFDALDSAGYDPLADMFGTSAMKALMAS